MVVSIGNGVLKANDPNNLSEFGGHITLTNNWAECTLQGLNWLKRKGTTGKIEPPLQLLAEERFNSQKSVPTVSATMTSSDLVINLDQTPLSYVSPGK